ncbi:hypothetical protein [Pararhodobacter sp. CCB-MM2]|nr:hypothetical protein [Pararhodobacter sp. CCB-MM2]MCA2013851.1 hypothetical protein [Cereibacter sphaeroides]
MPLYAKPRLNALRLWSAVALALMLAGAVTALDAPESPANPHQTLFSGAI